MNELKRFLKGDVTKLEFWGFLFLCVLFYATAAYAANEALSAITGQAPTLAGSKFYHVISTNSRSATGQQVADMVLADMVDGDVPATITRDSEAAAAYEPIASNDFDPDRLVGDTVDDNQLDAGVMPAATNSAPGHMTAAQVTALEAIDTEAELEALLELQDLQGAVTAGQLPAATELAIGALEKATTAEATTGTDTDRAVTPAGVRAHGDDRYQRTGEDAEVSAINASIPITRSDEGTHTGTTHATILTDSGAAWVVDDLIGFTVYNDTDSSSGTITDNDATTVTVSALSGGTDNDWDNADSYRVEVTTAKVNVRLQNAPATTWDLLYPSYDNAQLGGIDDTKGNGDTTYIWSADKVVDQLALKEDLLSNEAGLYAALSDVSQFFEPGDTLQGNSSTTLPGTCSVGDMYWDTDADTDGSLYVCRATNIWKEVDDDGAAGGLGNVVEDTTPQLGGQLDINGQSLGDGTLELLKFSETVSAVNEVTIKNAATGNGPEVYATGGDANVDLIMRGKGTGKPKLYQSIQLPVVAWTTDTATGDGKFYYHVGKDIAGMNLVDVHAEVITAGTTGTTDIQIYNINGVADMLTTKITIDSAETGSDTAATAAVIDTANDDVAENDMLRIDADAVSTTAAKGLIVTLGFEMP